MAQVILEKLGKIYPDKTGAGQCVIPSLDLTIQDREFMVLVGPSGCGKSTTLRMIAGLEGVSSGRILIDGRVVNDLPPRDRDIAMVFQNYALYPHMSVFENMAFSLKLRGLPKPEMAARVHEAAAMLGLEKLLERRPKDLSGGQRQRVALGRAIVRKPKVFLFDEPLSNLDAKMRVAMRAEIARLHRQLEATMIYVTHDQTEAMTMGDRICVLKDGRIRQVDAPLVLYHQPQDLFVAGFVGSPPINVIAGSIVRGEVGLFFAPAGCSWRLPLTGALAACAEGKTGDSVLLGVRPENIREVDAGAGAPAEIVADIEVCEPMGAETYLHLCAGATRFIARMRPSDRHTPGGAVKIEFDLARAHLFDPVTEKRL